MIYLVSHLHKCIIVQHLFEFIELLFEVALAGISWNLHVSTAKGRLYSHRAVNGVIMTRGADI